jgi:hypothetical protein
MSLSDRSPVPAKAPRKRTATPPTKPPAGDTVLEEALRAALKDETDTAVRDWLKALLADSDAMGAA